MMQEEFLRELRAIPGHDQDGISAEDYALVEYVYTWHPAIPDVGGKRAVAGLYAVGGLLVMRDMLPRAQKAETADGQAREIRRDIAGMQERLNKIMAEVYA